MELMPPALVFAWPPGHHRGVSVSIPPAASPSRTRHDSPHARHPPLPRSLRPRFCRRGAYLDRGRASRRHQGLLLADGQARDEEDQGPLGPLRPRLGRRVEPGGRERLPLHRRRRRRRQGRPPPRRSTSPPTASGSSGSATATGGKRPSAFRSSSSRTAPPRGPASSARIRSSRKTMKRSSTGAGRSAGTAARSRSRKAPPSCR